MAKQHHEAHWVAYLSFKFLELFVLLFFVRLDLFFGLVSRFLYTLCAV